MVPLVIQSVSIAEDISYKSLADISQAAGSINYRILGGLMVNLHALLYPDLQLPLRATVDADVGIDVVAVTDTIELCDALQQFGFSRVAGDRFTKGVAPHQQAVDILFSETADTSQFAKAGEIHAIQVPGLRRALLTPALKVSVTSYLTTGAELRFLAPLPTLVDALTIKLIAWSRRLAATDEDDINRLLEIAAHTSTALDGKSSNAQRKAASILRESWDSAQRPPRLRALARSYLSDQL